MYTFRNISETSHQTDIANLCYHGHVGESHVVVLLASKLDGHSKQRQGKTITMTTLHENSIRAPLAYIHVNIIYTNYHY